MSTPQRATGSLGDPPTDTMPSMMSASTLIGDNVYNHHEELLGDIKEIMLDIHSGNACYAVVAFGGILGLGEKLFAVPWRALTLDAEKKRFVLNVPVDHLKGAPGFHKYQWPDMTDVAWAQSIHTYYGTLPEDAQPNSP